MLRHSKATLQQFVYASELHRALDLMYKANNHSVLAIDVTSTNAHAVSRQHTLQVRHLTRLEGGHKQLHYLHKTPRFRELHQEGTVTCLPRGIRLGFQFQAEKSDGLAK